MNVLPGRTIALEPRCWATVQAGRPRCVQACDRHKTSPTASAALGRALLGTLLMGAFREEGEKTQVRAGARAQHPAGSWPSCSQHTAGASAALPGGAA